MTSEASFSAPTLQPDPNDSFDSIDGMDRLSSPKPNQTKLLPMKTDTNFIMFSDPSGIGKSIYMQPLREKLEAHGYTVENHRRFVGTTAVGKRGWKTKIFEDVGKNCESSHFCLIEVCTADQGIGMEISGSALYRACSRSGT